MIKIRILSVGKTKEEWLEDALNEYVKRLKSTVTLDFIWAKNDAQLLQLADQESMLICLDPQGSLQTSEEFSIFLMKKIQEGGSRVCFVIGGAEGLPSKLKQSCQLISLSRLTFTHQITRLVLVEQIYRSMEIAKGTKYHK